MELKDYVNKIKLQLTGGVIELEIPDDKIEEVVNNTIRELDNYYNVVQLLEVDASKCIDLVDYPMINDVIAIHRPTYISDPNSGISDPSYIAYLQTFNMGSNYFNPSNLTYKVASYSLSQQIRNTLSTDLDFTFDRRNRKLYINYSQGVPSKIVIEFVPRLLEASDILSEHWQDILYRLSLADVKTILGRIRTRYRQTNALYEDDGDTILAEGTTEGAEIRARLKEQADLVLPLD